MTPPVEPLADIQSKQDRALRVRTIIDDCIGRRAAGERYDDGEVLAAHPDLPELAQALAHLRAVERACDGTPHIPLGKLDAASGAPRPESQDRLPLRCPQCQSAIAVDVASPRSEVACPYCGGRFRLIDGDARARADGPREIAHFELVERLGVGGFGTVWKAYDTQLERMVALKLPHRGRLAANEAEVLWREARSAAQLHHPGIVQVFEVGLADGTVYVASEFVEGQSLADRLADQRMSAREAAELCRGIAAALHHAHEFGVIHRDLKPENILLDRDGQPHVADFGLARRLAGEATLTLDGQLLGTPAYMSPEQARGEAHTADRASDVYSLGVILFQLLTGELPFRGSVERLVAQIVHDAPPAPRRLNGHVPRDLETICVKCLEKVPSQRYPTALALADDLGRFLKRQPIQARPVSRLEHAWRWCRRRPALAGLGSAVAVLLIAVAAIASWVSIHEREAARRARWERYLSDMHLAVQAWDRGDVQQVMDVVQRQRPQTGETDLRGFEWYYLWKQLRSNQPLLTLSHEAAVNSVAYSPDGTLLATGAGHGGDNAARVWNARTGELVNVLHGHTFRVDFLAFSPDGRHLVTISNDGRIWDVIHGEELYRLEDPMLDYQPLFTARGDKVILGSMNGPLTIWDLDAGRVEGTLSGHTYSAWPGVWLPDGTLLSHSLDGTVRRWDLTTQRALQQAWKWPVNDASMHPALSADGRFVWQAQRDGSLRVFDLETGQLQSTFVPRGASVAFFTWSPDRKTIAAGLSSGEVQLWSATTGQLVGRLRSHVHSAWRLAYSPDGTRLASSSHDGTVKVWDVTKPTATEEQQAHIGFALSVAVDRSSRWAASGGADAKVHLWDLDTGERWKTLEGHFGWTSVAFSPTEDLLATGGKDGAIRLWDLPSGNLRGTHSGFADNWPSLSFSPDGSLLATAGKEPSARVFDLRSQRVRELPHPKKVNVLQVAFSPDGQLLVLGDAEGGVQLLNTRTWTEAGRLRANRAIDSLAFSPNGQLLSIGTVRGTASVWEVGSGSEVLAVRHGGQVKDMVFTKDGRSLITASDDFRIRVWDLATRDERAVFLGHNNWVAGLAISPDGRTLVSCSDDGYVCFWRAASPQDGQVP